MNTADFDYNFPKNLIATHPISPRDHSRLLLLDKKTGNIEHKHFYDIVDYLQAGDLLVMNNSKVFPARLHAIKETGGKIEVMLHRRLASDENNEVWQAMIGGKGAKPGRKLSFKNSALEVEIIKNNEDGTWDLKFNLCGEKFMAAVDKIGEVPVPPYINKRRKAKGERRQDDKDNYQTVYADDAKVGSVAAPTAGFHFSPDLIEKIKIKGVKIVYVTLHVGLGTFAPIKTETVEEHQIHSEYVEISKEILTEIRKAKEEKRRVIAVGTTSVRTLESFSSEIQNSKFKIQDLHMWTDIYIYPGYKFQIVDAMTTNFHLPKSSLLLLVSAFASTEPSRSLGKKNIDKAYQEAINNKYRFYSYGDAMMII